MNFVSINGLILPADEPAILLSNSSYHYGDALIETVKVLKGRMQLASYHFARLLKGMDMLKYPYGPDFNIKKLENDILLLCRKNELEAMARVRLTVSRDLQYSIEAFPLDNEYQQLNTMGWEIDIFEDANKSCDQFSNLKSANYLPYQMAAIHAREKGLDDCILLNVKGLLCDTSIANIFIVKHGTVITPALKEGCIAGVMRRVLLENLPLWGYEISERAIDPSELHESDEVFLSNAIRGIRWVGQYREKQYSNEFARRIFESLSQKIYG